MDVRAKRRQSRHSFTRLALPSEDCQSHGSALGSSWFAFSMSLHTAWGMRRNGVGEKVGVHVRHDRQVASIKRPLFSLNTSLVFRPPPPTHNLSLAGLQATLITTLTASHLHTYPLYQRTSPTPATPTRSRSHTPLHPTGRTNTTMSGPLSDFLSLSAPRLLSSASKGFGNSQSGEVVALAYLRNFIASCPAASAALAPAEAAHATEVLLAELGGITKENKGFRGSEAERLVLECLKELGRAKEGARVVARDEVSRIAAR